MSFATGLCAAGPRRGSHTLAEVKRRRRGQAMLDLIASWEADEGAIDFDHLGWADAVFDRATTTVNARLQASPARHWTTSHSGGPTRNA